MILRPYQVTALDRLTALFTHGYRSVVLAAPCGFGKTIIAVELIRRHIESGGRAVFIAPRCELIDQTAAKLDALGLHYGVLMADDPRRDMWAPVQLASIDTLRSRLRRCGMVPIADPSLVIVDEAHLYVTQYRVDLLNQWPNALRVGLTATPARKDGRGLRVLFDALIEVATVRELTADGYLSGARYYSLSEPDLSRVRLVAGDYNIGDLRNAMAPLVGRRGADVARTRGLSSYRRLRCRCKAFGGALQAVSDLRDTRRTRGFRNPVPGEESCLRPLPKW